MLIPRNLTSQRYLIPTSLTQSLGSITAVVNGRSYSASVGTITASAIYYLYLKQNGSSLHMVSVSTAPKAYRALYPEAILIGAFMASARSTPDFGCFMNIEGAPKGSPVPYAATLAGVGTVSSHTVTAYRDGSHIVISSNWVNGATSATQFTHSLPSGLSQVNVSSFFQIVGSFGAAGAVTSQSMVPVISGGTNVIYIMNLNTTGGGIMNGNAIGTNGNGMTLNASIQIQGWDNTPLKDL